MSTAPAILLYSPSNELEAAMIQAALEAHGIPNTMVKGTSGPAYIEPNRLELWIPSRLADQGRAVIMECLRSGDSPLASLRTWLCKECGEQNERGFQICWSCNAEAAT